MGLHFGEMTAVSSWMCLMAGAWESSAQPWVVFRCAEPGLVVVSMLPRKRIRDRACR